MANRCCCFCFSSLYQEQTFQSIHPIVIIIIIIMIVPERMMMMMMIVGIVSSCRCRRPYSDPTITTTTIHCGMVVVMVMVFHPEFQSRHTEHDLIAMLQQGRALPTWILNDGKTNEIASTIKQ
jgi:hypothetical protein